MHIIEQHDPWAPKKQKTYQEILWEQQELAAIEARARAEEAAKAAAEAANRPRPEGLPPTPII